MQLRPFILSSLSIIFASSVYATGLCDKVQGGWLGTMTDFSTPCTWSISVQVEKSPYNENTLLFQFRRTSNNPICAQDSGNLWARCENGKVELNAGRRGVLYGNVQNDNSLYLCSGSTMISLQR